MSDIDQTRFNALCDVVIYHFCDLMHKAGDENSKSAKLLVEQNVMEDTENGEAAYTEYEELLVEHALAELPDGFSKTYDYWGAPCISNKQGWNAPKHDNPEGDRVFFAGDSTRIMFFQNHEALVEYTTEKVADAECPPASLLD